MLTENRAGWTQVYSGCIGEGSCTDRGIYIYTLKGESTQDERERDK
jgi:hypothetical protein